MLKKIKWYVVGVLTIFVISVTIGWWKMLTDADWADTYRDVVNRFY